MLDVSVSAAAWEQDFVKKKKELLRWGSIHFHSLDKSRVVVFKDLTLFYDIIHPTRHRQGSCRSTPPPPVSPRLIFQNRRLPRKCRQYKDDIMKSEAVTMYWLIADGPAKVFLWLVLRTAAKMSEFCFQFTSAAWLCARFQLLMYFFYFLY